MSNELDKLLDSTGKAIQTIPDLYDDALKPTAKESGKVLSIIPRTINAALAPLRQWIAQKEYNVAETEKLLAQKLEHVGEEKIVTPEPYVAIPAMQAISYSMNSDELRNLYANLLAKSMVIDTKELVHPSFVEIIKQMSPIDAKVFELIMVAHVRPLITLKYSSKNGGESIIQEHCSWISQFSISQCCTSFDSLMRLGLISIPALESYTHKENYELVKQNPNFKSIHESVSSHSDEDISLVLEELYIKINDISELFYQICVKDF